MMSSKKSSYEAFRLTPKRENDLRRNGPAILDSLILTDKFFSILCHDYTLTREMAEDVKARPMQSSQISRLLDIIPKRGNSGFETFLKAMVETDQDSVALLLDDLFASDLIKERDAKRHSNNGGQQVQDNDDEVRSNVQPNVSSSEYSTQIASSIESAWSSSHSVYQPSHSANQPSNPYSSMQTPASQQFTQFLQQGLQAYRMPLMQYPDNSYVYPPFIPPHPHVYQTQPMWFPSAHSNELPDLAQNMDQLNVSRTNTKQCVNSQAHVPPLIPPPREFVTESELPSRVTQLKSTKSHTEPPSVASVLDESNDSRSEDEPDKGITPANTNNINDVCNIPFLDNSKLEEDLKLLTPKRREIVKNFIAAVSNNPDMKIKVESMKDTIKAVNLIREEGCYCVRRRPHAGLVVIIAIEQFFTLNARKGTKHDITNLTSLFQQLDFKVKTFNDLFAKEIDKQLETESKSEELEKYDVFVLIVMSHGIHGEVYGSDGQPVSIDKIVERFDGQNCKNLKGKPKLFFFQSCQTVGDAAKSRVMQSDGSGDTNEVVYGSEQDEMIRLMTARFSETDAYKPKLPDLTNQSPYQTDGDEHDKANMFIAYASYKGYPAWRVPDMGSFFIRALVYVCAFYSHEKHVYDLFAELNDLLHYFPSKDGNTSIPQLAPLESTLRKPLYLFPGYDGRDFV